MAYLSGVDREQSLLLPERVEDYIGPEHPVRFLDAFVERLDLRECGFVRAQPAGTGRPGYSPATLLKLYLWGYLNRVRSSRRLELECRRNLEVIWLLRRLAPDFKTIADFRRDNAEAFKGVFASFVDFCRKLDLFGRELIAVDGTVIKACNAPSKNLSREQIEARLERIREQAAAFLRELEAQDRIEQSAAQDPQDPQGGERAQDQRQQSAAEADCREPTGPAETLQPEQSKEADACGGAAPAELSETLSPEQIRERLEALRRREAALEAALHSMEKSGRKDYSFTDADSARMKKLRAAFNAQIAVDNRNHLIAAAEVVADPTDHHQLEPMALAAMEALEVGKIRALADGGYHDIEALAACAEAGIETYVPRPLRDAAKTEGFYARSAFEYDAQSDSYRCPAGESLPLHTRTRKGGAGHKVYFNKEACGRCAQKPQCTAADWRRVSRGQNEEAAEETAARIKASPELMKERKQLVEHPFGTMKFWNHQHFFLMRGLSRVRAEFQLSALSCNLRRVLGLLPFEQLLEKLSGWKPAAWRKAAAQATGGAEKRSRKAAAALPRRFAPRMIALRAFRGLQEAVSSASFRLQPLPS